MARIKLTLPDTRVARIRVPVRISDINYGQHVGHDSLVTILHEARVQWFWGLGFSEMDVYGRSLILSELTVQFQRESFYGDQLEIQIFLGEITRVGFEIFYQVSALRSEETLEVALAKTTLVCFDYTQKKVASLPGALLVQLQELSLIP